MVAKLSGASFGDAGRNIVIEEGLIGEECSLLVLCDGTTAVPLVPAQDFKRIGDGDAGPNTGGMGAYAPMPHVGPHLVAEIMRVAVEPLVAELRRRGIDYRGVLYAGLMLTADGPRSLSTTSASATPRPRWCCPCCRATRPSCSWPWPTGRLAELPAPTFSDAAAVCVVLAAPGYPDRPRTGDRHRAGWTTRASRPSPSTGPPSFTPAPAGTSPTGPFRTAGGRVLGRHRGGARPGPGPGQRLRRRRAHRLGRAAAPLRHRPVGQHRVGGTRPMIPRYSPPDMAALFTDTARFAMWLEVELLATEAQAAVGVVPAEDAATCRAKAPTVDDVFVADVLEREKVTDHDVAAFVDVVQERIGMPAGSYIHYGLTSSDVVDTALCATLTKAADLLLVDLDALRRRPRRRGRSS